MGVDGVSTGRPGGNAEPALCESCPELIPARAFEAGAISEQNGVARASTMVEPGGMSFLPVPAINRRSSAGTTCFIVELFTNTPEYRICASDIGANCGECTGAAQVAHRNRPICYNPADTYFLMEQS